MDLFSSGLNLAKGIAGAYNNWVNRPSAPQDKGGGSHYSYPNSQGGMGPVAQQNNNATSNNNGGGGGGGTYRAAVAPPDPGIAVSNGLKSQIGSRIGDLNNIYNSIYGQIDQSAQSQRGTLEKDYNNQYQTLQDQYTQNMRYLPWMNAARGLADSSFSSNDQRDAGNIFADNNQSIANDEDKNLKSLAGYVNQQKAIYHGQQEGLGQTQQELGLLPSNSGSTYQLGNLLNGLIQQEATAKGQAGQFGSDSAFMQGLNAIAPSQNQGASQLQSQLATLKTANLPQFASDQIASAVINKNTQQDPNLANYYLQHWANQQGA